MTAGGRLHLCGPHPVNNVMKLLEGVGEIRDIAGVFKTLHNTKCVSAEQLLLKVFIEWAHGVESMVLYTHVE